MAASTVGGLRTDAAATGSATGGRTRPQVNRAVQGNHRSPGFRDGVSDDMSALLPGVGRVRDAGCMDLHPRDRA